METMHDLTIDELVVWQAVRKLTEAGRTVNTSQVALRAGMSRTAADRILTNLRARHFVKDVSANAAHHWRQTGKEPANA